MNKFLVSTFLSTALLLSANYGFSENINLSGFDNGNSSLDINLITKYSIGEANEDGGLVEIIAYNKKAKKAYAVAGAKGILVTVDMMDLSKELRGTSIKMKDIITATDKNFDYGDMSSVAINDANTHIAVALQADEYTENGRVAIFKLNNDGTINTKDVKILRAGIQPDALTFTPNGKYIFVANEGEPREGYGKNVINPEGSVSLIDVEKGTSKIISFDESKRAEYIKNGAIVYDNASLAEDFEPEYIVADNDYAYVVLQEANAIATLDIKNQKFTDVTGLGFQDFNKVKLDLVADEKIKLENQNVYGMRMPDGISMMKKDGETYLFLANEGDGREWGEEESENFYVNEVKGKTSPTGNVTLSEKVTWFDPRQGYSSMDQSKAYLYGTRSFSIFKATKNGLELVADSESGFEEITAKYIPNNFNASNDDKSLEDRSGKKGPEPEYVAVGNVDGKDYAFIGLERISGVMVYDVTNPSDISYVNYINTRDFSEDIKGDVGPEGIVFVSASDSSNGKALVLAANENSGTLSVYQVTASK